jgi:hypothetical protein
MNPITCTTCSNVVPKPTTAWYSTGDRAASGNSDERADRAGALNVCDARIPADRHRERGHDDGAEEVGPEHHRPPREAIGERSEQRETEGAGDVGDREHERREESIAVGPVQHVQREHNTCQLVADPREHAGRKQRDQLGVAQDGPVLSRSRGHLVAHA